MTKKQYIQGIENFGKLQGCFSGEGVVEKYPYFMIGRLLWTMNEKLEDKTVLALMHPDRTCLSAILQTKKKVAIKEKEFVKKEVSKDKFAKTKNEISKKKAVAIEEMKEDSASILQKRLAELAKSKKQEHKNAVLENAEPIFEPESSVSLDELVEKFNNHPPSITPIGDDFDEESLYIDKGKHSSLEQMNIISETLAEIYVSQKLFDKAIEIYRELLLKYPEKNAIFASLIKKLENNVKQE